MFKVICFTYTQGILPLKESKHVGKGQKNIVKKGLIDRLKRPKNTKTYLHNPSTNKTYPKTPIKPLGSYVEPQSDKIMEVEIGEHHWEHDVPYDDTIITITLVP